MPVLSGAEPYHHSGGSVGALLCHGFTGSPYSMRPWAEYLAAASLTVALPRLPGHGTDWRDMNLTTWDDWYTAVDREFGELRERCDQVFVMGLSMGGALALRVAQRHGGAVAGVVVVNPSVLSHDPRLRALPLLHRFVPSLGAIGDDIRKPGVSEMAYDRTPLRALESLRRAWPTVVRDLPRVTQPLLLLRSYTDHVVEPESSRQVLSRVSSRDLTEIVLHDSYHVATLDHDAPRIFAESLDFVNRLRAQAVQGP
ncbi:MAG TPA: alpha/beta fold hydrolase [Sporichthyaceae bacterium]